MKNNRRILFCYVWFFKLIIRNLMIELASLHYEHDGRLRWNICKSFNSNLPFPINMSRDIPEQPFSHLLSFLLLYIPFSQRLDPVPDIPVGDALAYFSKCLSLHDLAYRRPLQ